MNLTLTAERHGYQAAEIHVLTKLLKLKYKEIPEEYIAKINDADTDALDEWCGNVLFANSLPEVFRNT